MSSQFIRKINLVVFNSTEVLDLSEFRIVFQVKAADVETPNNAAIRIYNLSQKTVQSVRQEFGQVTLSAGYESGNYGIIFSGTIKQFRVGKDSATETFLDILAADGDVGYNQGFVNTSLKSGATLQQTVNTLTAAMADPNVLNVVGGVKSSPKFDVLITKQYIPAIRGQVLFGMAKARMRNIAATLDASWSIQNGQVTFISREGYLPGQIIDINVGNGMVGMPTQTDDGIQVQCLINPAIQVGQLVNLNSQEIVSTSFQNTATAPVPYNSRASIQNLAPLSGKGGYYRVYVVEHEGDSRGNPWYTNLICLAVDLSSKTVVSGA